MTKKRQFFLLGLLCFMLTLMPFNPNTAQAVLGLSKLNYQEQPSPQKKKSRTEAKKERKGHFFFGGGFGGGFSNGWNINISPVAGYQFNDRLRAGLGVEYLYVNQRIGGAQNKYSSFGPYAFSDYYISGPFFAHAEYQLQNFKFNSQSFSAESLLIGGGYTQNFGRGPGLFLLVLYDVLYDINTPFRRSNPWIIRPGFVYGF